MTPLESCGHDFGSRGNRYVEHDCLDAFVAKLAGNDFGSVFCVAVY